MIKWLSTCLPKSSASIPTNLVYDDDLNPEEDLMVICEVTTKDLLEAWRKMKNKEKSTDHSTELSMKVISKLNYFPLFQKYVVDFFNFMIRNLKMPAVFKTSMIIPILKKTQLDPTDFNNYRPQLSQFYQYCQNYMKRLFLSK